MIGYPIHQFFPGYEKVESQLNYKDENLNDMVVNKKQMLENFKIDLNFYQNTWDDIKG